MQSLAGLTFSSEIYCKGIAACDKMPLQMKADGGLLSQVVTPKQPKCSLGFVI